MVIWLSGAYGVGKSTVAEALRGKMERALIFDAEEMGNAVRDNYPDHPYGYIFEDYPLWAEFCCRLIHDVHDTFQRDILVDMTLVREISRIRILDQLKEQGISVHYFVLTAFRQTIHDRILARGEEEDCWCMQNLDMAMAAATAIPGATCVDTEDAAPDEIAEQILGLVKNLQEGRIQTGRNAV